MAATIVPTSDLGTAIGASPHVERLYDNVQVEVPGVGLSAVKLQAWNAIEEFFIQSTVRREKVFWQMAGGVQTINFNPYDATWLVAWVLDYSGLSGGHGKIEIPATLRDLTWPVPTALRKGEAWLALKPVSFDAIECGGDVDLWSTWFEAILDGTLARLYGQPAKPFSAPPLAQLHGRRYRKGIAAARAFADANYSNDPRWTFPYHAMGRRKQ